MRQPEPSGSREQGEPDPFLPELDAGLSEFELLCDIWAADARESRYAAQRALAIVALVRRRRAVREELFGRDEAEGSRTTREDVLDGVPDETVVELALARQASEAETEQLVGESILLATKLRGTLAELFAGRLTVRKMRVIVDLLSDARDDVAAQVERDVLPAAEKLTAPQLRNRIRYRLAKLDAEALERRRRQAEHNADVHHRSVGNGMGQLVIDLPLHESLPCFDAIRQYAELLRAGGDERPIGLIRASVARDLILRPWDSTRPPVTAILTIHAQLAALSPAEPGVPQPGAEMGSEVVTAAQCRELLEQLGMLGIRPAPGRGSVSVAVHDASGRLVAVATRNELRRGAFGSRRRRWRKGTVGNRVAERQGAAADGPGLCPPAATSAYSPTAEQRRFVQARDRSCRWPGCRRAPARCDIDHVHPHGDGGPTDCWNLCCLCRRHHRIKTFSRDWHFELLADGSLLIRTPSGISRISAPPGWYEHPEPDPPWLEELAPPDPMRR